MQKWASNAKAEIQDLKKKYEQASQRCKELNDQLQSVEEDKKDLQQRYEEKCKEKRYLSDMLNRQQRASSHAEPVQKAQRLSNQNAAHHDSRQSQESHAIRASQQHRLYGFHSGASHSRAPASAPSTPQKRDSTNVAAASSSSFQVGRRASASASSPEKAQNMRQDHHPSPQKEQLQQQKQSQPKGQAAGFPQRLDTCNENGQRGHFMAFAGRDSDLRSPTPTLYQKQQIGQGGFASPSSRNSHDSLDLPSPIRKNARSTLDDR